MKKNIFIVSCILLTMAYAELWWDRVSVKADNTISALSQIEMELDWLSNDLRYVVIGNERMEQALEKISKQDNNVYLETDKLESKLEELVDELRELNGTMNMLTH